MTSLVDGVRSMTDLLASSAALVGIGGGLMYALTALGYQRFYGSFGITPSDVGITQSDIIAQTAVALALVGSATFLVSLLFYPIAAWLFRRAMPRPLIVMGIVGGYTLLGYAVLVFLFPALRSPFGALLGVFGIAFVVWLFRRPRSRRVVVVAMVGGYTLLGYAVLVLLFPVLRTSVGAVLGISGIAFIAILTTLAIRQHGSWSRADLRNLGRFLVMTLPVLFLISVFFTTARAESISAWISEGNLFPPGGRFTVLLDIRADPVCVKGLPRSPSSGSQAMYYFGRSGDLVVLYDQKNQKTIIKPAAEIGLAFVPYDQWPAYSIDAFNKKCASA